MSVPVAVLGGGAWGTALALAVLGAGNRPRLWMRDAATAAEINEHHRSSRFLPGIDLDPRLSAGTDLAAALDGAGCILAVVPAQALRGFLGTLPATDIAGVPLVLCAKGIERDTGRLMSQIAEEVLPLNPVAALSGPSFATDVARGLPTAVTIAAHDNGLAAELARILSGPAFRCYSTDDLIGVEIGGALKNVLAIAVGAASGAGLGASAQAALITRGFVEMRRLAAAFGARPETPLGLSGLGDLVLTCGSGQSRNFTYGRVLGSGGDTAGLPLAEGVATAGIAARLAADHGIEAPITDAVERMLAGRLTIAAAVAELLSRPLKAETD